jgi:hypothetical protein
VHTLFSSNSAYCHATGFLCFIPDSVLKTTAGVPNVRSCSCTALGMFVDQAAQHQNHPNMVGLKCFCHCCQASIELAPCSLLEGSSMKPTLALIVSCRQNDIRISMRSPAGTKPEAWQLPA